MSQLTNAVKLIVDSIDDVDDVNEIMWNCVERSKLLYNKRELNKVAKKKAVPTLARRRRKSSSKASAYEFIDDLRKYVKVWKSVHTQFGVFNAKNVENVSNVPLSFLDKHNIPVAPNGRMYYCMAYGDLFAYDNLNKRDRGVGFDFDTWTWSI